MSGSTVGNESTGAQIRWDWLDRVIDSLVIEGITRESDRDHWKHAEDLERTKLGHANSHGRDLCVARASKVTCVFLMSRWSWIVEIQRCNKNIIKDVTCLFKFSDQTFSRWIEFSLKCSVRIIIGNQFLFTNFCCYKINFFYAVHRTIKVTYSALFS